MVKGEESERLREEFGVVRIYYSPLSRTESGVVVLGMILSILPAFSC